MKCFKRIMGICFLASLVVMGIWAAALKLAGVTGYPDAAAIGIIGSADGPTSIFIAGEIAPWRGIAVCAMPIFLIIFLVAHVMEKKK